MEAKLKTDQGRAIVEGKTAVPFKTFVGLVLQRKVFGLFKDWGKEPVIIDSELLTDLASAAQDNRENTENILTVTLGIGVLVGIFAMTVFQIALVPFDITLTEREFLIIGGILVGMAFLTVILGKVKTRGKGHKLADAMEKVAGIVGR